MTTALIYHRLQEDLLQELKSSCPQVDFIVCADRQSLNQYLPQADILITFQCDPEMINKAPHLKWVQALYTGVDSYPRKLLADRNILLTSTKGMHAWHMTEYAIATLIIMARNLHRILKDQNSRAWKKFPQGEIQDRVLAIVGLGEIGREIARKAAYMGMQVYGIQKNPHPAEGVHKVAGMDGLEEVLGCSDYIINLLPLTPETENLFNQKRFAQMKQGSCFINMGRGGSVVEEDLVQALQTGHLAGFAGDVFRQEPLPEDHPLWREEKAMITPHIGGESTRYMSKALPIIERNLQAFIQNRPQEMLNRVDPEQEY